MSLYLTHRNPPLDSDHIPDGVFKYGPSSSLFIAIESAQAADIDSSELRRLLECVERLKNDFKRAEEEQIRLFGEEYDEDGEPVPRPALELPNGIRDAIIDGLERFCSTLVSKFGPNLDQGVPPELDAIAQRYRGVMLGAIITEDRRFIYNFWCSYDLFRSTIAYLERGRELNCLILVDT
jgi:hypothetical protein